MKQQSKAKHSKMSTSTTESIGYEIMLIAKPSPNQQRDKESRMSAVVRLHTARLPRVQSNPDLCHWYPRKLCDAHSTQLHVAIVKLAPILLSVYLLLTYVSLPQVSYEKEKLLEVVGL